MPGLQQQSPNSVHMRSRSDQFIGNPHPPWDSWCSSGQEAEGVVGCMGEEELTLGMSILLPRTRTGTWDSASSPSSASSSFLDSRKRSRSTASTRNTSASTCARQHRTVNLPEASAGERAGPTDALFSSAVQLLDYRKHAWSLLCSTDAKMCLSAASLPCFPAQGVQLSCQILKAPQFPQQHFNLMQNLRPLLSTNTSLAKGERELVLPPASLS